MVVFFCPKCKMLDMGNENEEKRCMSCNTLMLSLGISSLEWNSLDESRMKEIINEKLSALEQNSVLKQPSWDDGSDTSVVEPQNEPAVNPTPMGVAMASEETSKKLRALKCEMCDSNDMVKTGGFYVCQNCGTKYTVEEAKKMMFAGSVDVSGSTVKVDNSAFVEKYLANARRAKGKEDWEETEKYYNMVEQNDPTNIEAIFYSSYGKAKNSLIEADIYKRQAAFKVLTNCVSIIDDNYTIEKEDEEKKIIAQISTDIFGMATSNYVFNQRKNGYGTVVSSDKNQTITLFNTLGIEFVNTLEHIIKKYPEGDNRVVFFYELAVKHAEYVIQYGCLQNPDPLTKRYMDLHRAWNKVDASHEVPTSTPRPKNNSSGCYVATAVYGSYDCPQVWTLRRYRDYALAETWYGRSFIRTYYAISPTMVKWFGDKSWFQKMWKKRLDHMVEELQKKGYESTPYQDRTW